MKISHYITSIDIKGGGPSVSVTNLCEHLQKMQVQVDLVTLQSEHSIALQKDFHFPIHYINSVEGSAKKLFSGLNDISSIAESQIFHGQGIWEPLVHRMALTARITKRPYIITPRGMLEPWIVNRNKWKKKVALSLYQQKDIVKATLLQATSVQEADNIRKLGFNTPIEIIPNGIEITEYPLKTYVEKEKKQALFLSRIHPKKGIENLLAAWKQIENLTKDWELKIIGNGDASYITTLKKLIEKEGLRNVSLLPPAFGSVKIKAYHAADLFILPTYSENFGLVIAEALACGTPVLTTKETPWHELAEKQCGWWIDLGVESLVKSLKESLSMSEQALFEKGRLGRQLVTDKYSMESVAAQMLNLYKSIV